ncbi:unnamed protein product [Fraxinus pennsylvanica]|uniref:Uncharacterized protein n=1 Tax=Fraxinus pennsylvanica TaxID=56036 RepID=A0AAD2E3H9_9LAMI|nr:unnamed protein product [Fraxinus pennsylvanica]
MRTRYMERTNSTSGRGKRTLESGDDEEQQPDKKRPALASKMILCPISTRALFISCSSETNYAEYTYRDLERESYWPSKKLRICITRAGGFIASHIDLKQVLRDR